MSRHLTKFIPWWQSFASKLGRLITWMFCHRCSYSVYGYVHVSRSESLGHAKLEHDLPYFIANDMRTMRACQIGR
jgi:hypothetical protein